MARLRQAVIAVRDLDAAAAALRERLDLGEPFEDPAVAYFDLRNAVFAIGDQFLELVSPVSEDAAAARLIERRGGDCGYMAMLQVEDVGAARQRARELGMREVFEVEFDDITEAHLHPADIGGAIVSVSEARPAGSWRWGGPGWEARSVPGQVTALTVAVADPEPVERRWRTLANGGLPVEFVADSDERGIVTITVERAGEVIVIDPTDVTS